MFACLLKENFVLPQGLCHTKIAKLLLSKLQHLHTIYFHKVFHLHNVPVGHNAQFWY